MASGQLLCSFLFETGISSVAMDMAESFLFVGSITGKIHVINLIMVVRKPYFYNLSQSLAEALMHPLVIWHCYIIFAFLHPFIFHHLY